MFNHCVYMLLINLFLMPTIKAKIDVIIMSGNKLYAFLSHPEYDKFIMEK